MRVKFNLLSALAAASFLSGAAWAAEPPAKEVTLKGTILCAKCSLKESKKCQTAIQVKEGGKTVTYYLDDKGNKEEYHEPVCGGDRQEGTVIGTVTEKAGKKYITPTKVEYAKKGASLPGPAGAPARAINSCCGRAVKESVACCCCRK